MYELHCEQRKPKTEAEVDSEESDLAEILCRSKSKTVYQESPIKLEKFLGRLLNRWEFWVKPFISVVKANGWSDMQAIEALPAWLTSWAVEEFETLSRLFVE